MRALPPVGPPAVPVFVDPTGRRARWTRRLFVAVGVLASLYVATVGLSLVLPAGTLHLTVPGLGPVLPGPAPDLDRRPGRQAQQLADRVTRPQPEKSAAPRALPQHPVRTAAEPTVGALPSPPARAAVEPARSMRPSPVATGSPAPRTVVPSPTAAPPGQIKPHPLARPTGHPAATGHPTPRASAATPRPGNSASAHLRHAHP